jgi:NadR type nicotinamide-nucleotide adenylyltransferase
LESLKKIVIIGPESTGKSTLSAQLAEYYHTEWVPEYAREYLLTHGKEYTFEDLYLIGKNQLKLEDEYAERVKSGLLFIDTDMYVMKVWCEVVFGKVHDFIEEAIAQRKYDLYLLCDTDLPWVQDELREYPDLETRRKLFLRYYELMEHQEVPFVVIRGSQEERLQAAIDAVEKFKAGLL